MEIDREMVYQVVFAGGAIVLFVLLSVFISLNYGTNGHLTAQGGQLMVGALAGFIVLMLGAGMWLERQEF